MSQVTFTRKDTLGRYSDWLIKAKHDFETYKESGSVYDLANCILTLNALPEWISKSEDASPNLKQVANDAIHKMKNLSLDPTRMTDVDHQLRFIRLFSNHAKHGDKKEQLPEIVMSFTLPATLPAKFENIKIGETQWKAETIMQCIIDFWSAHVPVEE